MHMTVEQFQAQMIKEGWVKDETAPSGWRKGEKLAETALVNCVRYDNRDPQPVPTEGYSELRFHSALSTPLPAGTTFQHPTDPRVTLGPITPARPVITKGIDWTVAYAGHCLRTRDPLAWTPPQGAQR